jgi:hypothetical protein
MRPTDGTEDRPLSRADDLPNVREPLGATSLADILAELRQDVRMGALLLAPRMSSDQSQIFRFGMSLGLTMDEVIQSRAQFLEQGLWSRRADDTISVDPQLVDQYDLSLQDFTGLTLQIISACSEEGPCWYDSMIIATTEDLKKAYYKKINQALKELIEGSAQARCDRVVAWSHVGLDLQKLGRLD